MGGVKLNFTFRVCIVCANFDAKIYKNMHMRNTYAHFFYAKYLFRSFFYAKSYNMCQFFHINIKKWYAQEKGRFFYENVMTLWRNVEMTKEKDAGIPMAHTRRMGACGAGRPLAFTSIVKTEDAPQARNVSSWRADGEGLICLCPSHPTRWCKIKKEENSRWGLRISKEC